MNIENMRTGDYRSTSCGYQLDFGSYGENMGYTKGSDTFLITDSDGDNVELLVCDIEYIKKSLDRIQEINGN